MVGGPDQLLERQTFMDTQPSTNNVPLTKTQTGPSMQSAPPQNDPPQDIPESAKENIATCLCWRRLWTKRPTNLPPLQTRPPSWTPSRKETIQSDLVSTWSGHGAPPWAPYKAIFSLGLAKSVEFWASCRKSDHDCPTSSLRSFSSVVRCNCRYAQAWIVAIGDAVTYRPSR